MRLHGIGADGHAKRIAIVAVEVGGRRGHSSDAERAKDARRRNELQALGFVVLEFTYVDVHERPGYVLAMLRRHGL